MIIMSHKYSKAVSYLYHVIKCVHIDDEEGSELATSLYDCQIYNLTFAEIKFHDMWNFHFLLILYHYFLWFCLEW